MLYVLHIRAHIHYSVNIIHFLRISKILVKFHPCMTSILWQRSRIKRLVYFTMVEQVKSCVFDKRRITTSFNCQCWRLPCSVASETNSSSCAAAPGGVLSLKSDTGEYLLNFATYHMTSNNH